MFKERLLTSIGLSLWFCFVYVGCNYLTSLRSDLGTAAFAWEFQIPFLPILIIPYWSVDLFFAAAPFFIPTKEKLRLFRNRILLTITLAGLFFLCFPLRLLFQRPPVPGILGSLFDSLDTMYNFYNLAPSLHVSLRCILWTAYIPLVSGISRIGLQIWFILIGASTLFCWQHHVIDVFTGQLLGFAVIHLLPEHRLKKEDIDPARHINANPRIAALYFSGAALFVLLTRTLPLWGIIFLWPAAALFVVGAGYAGLGPAIFRKHDGQTPPGTRLFLAPFYLGLWLSYRYYTSRQERWVEVVPGFFLGRAPRKSELSEFQALGVKEVLDLNAEWSESTELRRLRYHNIQILDLTRPSGSQLEAARRFLRNGSAGNPIYIHCSLGLGRGAKILLYHLFAERHVESLDIGMTLIEGKRKGIVISEHARIYLLNSVSDARYE